MFVDTGDVSYDRLQRPVYQLAVTSKHVDSRDTFYDAPARRSSSKRKSKLSTVLDPRSSLLRYTAGAIKKGVRKLSRVTLRHQVSTKRMFKAMSAAFLNFSSNRRRHQLL